MKPAVLQLKRYFVTELNVAANPEHDPGKTIDLSDSDLIISPSYAPDKSDPRQWQVTLRIHQPAAPTANAPYAFTVEIVGSFSVAKGYPREKIEWMVRTNAASVLYSTAREILRSAMSQGPFCPLLIPTVSFYTPETKTPPKKHRAN